MQTLRDLLPCANNRNHRRNTSTDSTTESNMANATSASVTASFSPASASSELSPHLTLYPVLDGYIGQMTLSPAQCKRIDTEKKKQVTTSLVECGTSASSVQTVVLLDRSMSMGKETRRLMTEVFPGFLAKMYPDDPEAKLTVIGFDDEATMLQLSAKELKKSDLRARGGTVLSSALHLLTDYVEQSIDPKKKKAADEKIKQQPAGGLDLIANAAGASSSSSSPFKPVSKKRKTNAFCPLDDPLRDPPPLLGPQDTLIIDVCFIMDATASMGSWIEQAKTNIFKLVDQVKQECDAVRDGAPTRIRLSMVVYRDYFDQPRFATLDFTEDVAEFHAFVSKQPPIGGGDGPEDLLGGLDLALKQSWSKDAHTRIALLIADAPCHGCADDSAESKKFKDPLLPIEVQEQLVGAFQEKRINLSFTRIAAYTDEMMARFQSYYYSAETRKSIKVLQLGQRVERFLPSVLSMISSTALAGAAEEGTVPKDATPLSKQIRLLTISDGEIEDMHATLKTAEKLADLLKDEFTVNSQAVRFFTSDDQPDTRGLSSTLQLNTLLPAQLLDLNAKEEKSAGALVEKLAGLFEKDGLERKILLECAVEEEAEELKEEAKEERKESASSSSSRAAAILQPAPWSAPQSSLALVSGSENTFWLKKAPTSAMINGSVKCTVSIVPDALHSDNYASVLQSKVSYFFHQLKVLKIVNSEQSKERIEAITSYFSALETYLATITVQSSLASIGGSSTSMRARMAVLKAQLSRKQTSIAMRMREVANDDRVDKLNSHQAAEYLRSASKSSKAIARRAESAGFEFDSVVHKELRQMAKHIDELADIDDSDHTRSFYSQDTTLGGLRTVCELTKEMESKLILEDLTVHDVLPLMNIVGVAAAAPIGDYPDAMTYRLDEVYLGTTVSLSDILQAHIASHGEKLRPIGMPDDAPEITNCVPIFDDQRIHYWLKKHAPSLLEYSASVGMRRLVTAVPATQLYTIAAGVWKMVDAMNKERSEICVNMFTKMLQTYEVACGGYFKHIVPMLTAPQKNSDMSYWIGNNGITNMIAPLLAQIRADGRSTKNLPAVLRALYAFEIRQATKRFIKRKCPEAEKDKLDGFALRMLHKLLGLKAESPFKTAQPPMFASNPPSPRFCDDCDVDGSLLEEMCKNFWYLDHVCHLPEFIMAACGEKPVSAFQAIPPISDEYCMKTLGLQGEMTLQRFKLVNIVQSILFPSKVDRVDSDNACMKIIDLKGDAATENFLRGYVRKFYTDLYASEMAARAKEERALLCTELVGAMCATSSMSTFTHLFTHGMTRGRTKIRIENASSYGFNDLKLGLLDKKEEVPKRLKKVEVLILGRDREAKEESAASPAAASSAKLDHEEKKSNHDEKKSAVEEGKKTQKGSFASVVKTSVLPKGSVVEITGAPVWNGGHSLFIGDIDPYEVAFMDTADYAAWVVLKALHMLTYSHHYRVSGTPNRHGHHQGKMSYWARGFSTIDKLEKVLSKEEWEDYKKIHHDCCGIGPKAAVVKVKAKGKK